MDPVIGGNITASKPFASIEAICGPDYSPQSFASLEAISEQVSSSKPLASLELIGGPVSFSQPSAPLEAISGQGSSLAALEAAGRPVPSTKALPRSGSFPARLFPH